MFSIGGLKAASVEAAVRKTRDESLVGKKAVSCDKRSGVTGDTAEVSVCPFENGGPYVACAGYPGGSLENRQEDY